MKILVTGAGGFVGTHARRELLAAGHEVLALAAPGENAGPGALVADIRDAVALDHVLAAAQPEGILHLAGMAFVPAAWQKPVEATEINLIGVINLLESTRVHCPEARVLVVSSAEIYGQGEPANPLHEEEALFPCNLYAMTKAAADMTARIYARKYRIPAMTARPVNHTGPGQSPSFVAVDFATQLLAIARGEREALMRVGNLDSRREFLDVRDVVRAYRRILESGRGGCSYNIASDKRVTIRELLEMLIRLTGAKPTVEVDPARFRPTDVAPRLDTRLLRNHTGWTPQFTLEQTLADIVAHCSAIPA